MPDINKTPFKHLSLPEHYDPSVDYLKKNMHLIDSLLQRALPNTDSFDYGVDDLNAIVESGKYVAKSTAEGKPDEVGMSVGTVLVNRIDNYVTQIWESAFQGSGEMFFRISTYPYPSDLTGTIISWTPWTKIWNGLNDGEGSSLDADTLDGLHSSKFFRQMNDPSSSEELVSDFNGAENEGIYYIFSSDSSSNAPLPWTSVMRWICITHKYSDNAAFGSFIYQIALAEDIFGSIYFRKKDALVINSNWSPWYTIWHEGIDGTDSGLDADLLDGKHANEVSIPTISGSDDYDNPLIINTDYGYYSNNPKHYPILHIDKGYFKLAENDEEVHSAPVLMLIGAYSPKTDDEIILFDEKYCVTMLPPGGSLIVYDVNVYTQTSSISPVRATVTNAETVGGKPLTEINTLPKIDGGTKSNPLVISANYEEGNFSSLLSVESGYFRIAEKDNDTYSAPALVIAGNALNHEDAYEVTVYRGGLITNFLVDTKTKTSKGELLSVNAKKAFDSDLLDGLHANQVSIPTNAGSSVQSNPTDISMWLDGVHIIKSGFIKLYTDSTTIINCSSTPCILFKYTVTESASVRRNYMTLIHVHGIYSYKLNANTKEFLEELSLGTIVSEAKHANYADESDEAEYANYANYAGESQNTLQFDGREPCMFAWGGESFVDYSTRYHPKHDLYDDGALNKLINSGLYHVYVKPNNSPSGIEGNFSVTVIAGDIYINPKTQNTGSNYVTQIAVEMLTGKLFIRCKDSGLINGNYTWGGWSEVSPKIPVLTADPVSPSEGQMWILSS